MKFSVIVKLKNNKKKFKKLNIKVNDPKSKRFVNEFGYVLR